MDYQKSMSYEQFTLINKIIDKCDNIIAETMNNDDVSLSSIQANLDELSRLSGDLKCQDR